jgi:hypothetical protein
VHLLLARLISVGQHPRGAQKPEESVVTLLFVDLSDPDATRPLADSLPGRPPVTRSSSQRIGAAPVSAIALPPEIEQTDAVIDWNAEAGRVARDTAGRLAEKREPRALDKHAAGLGPPPPKSSLRQKGDSEHFEGGVIIDWIDNGCYYSNQKEHIDAFGPALRLQVPTCTGRDRSGRAPLQSFEEWKNERDSR